MSISLNANFELLSAGLYLDARQQFNTIIEMKDFAESSIPDGFITYNKETQKHYVFSSSNTVDATLGKWREYNSGTITSYAIWTDGVDYKVGDIVLKDNIKRQCIVEHTSADFDVEKDNWIYVFEQYYYVSQAQYNQMITNGIITDETKDLYIIDGNANGNDNENAGIEIYEDYSQFPMDFEFDCVVYAKNEYLDNGVTYNNGFYFANATTGTYTRLGGSSEKQIKDWVSGSSYLEGDYIYLDGKLYRCLVTNSDIDFDEANWEQLVGGEGGASTASEVSYSNEALSSVLDVKMALDTIVGAINEISDAQLDTVGFSADYKNIILNRKSGLNPYTIPIASIINNTSLTELKDIDGTDIGNGKTLIYDGATGKHKYVGSTGTDELVKMDSTGDAHYLVDLLDKQTVINDNGILKVKKLDGQEVTITEINYLKGLTMNVMDLVSAFANGGVKVLNTPLNTASELDTMDRTSFIDGISYIVYVLADETHAGAKTTYLVDKTNTTFFGNADSQRNFTTNPIDLANEVTGKLGTSNIDVDSLWTLLTINDTYKTLTTNNEIFGTHGAKAMYDELITAIGEKANVTDLTTHTNNTDIHITSDERIKWNNKANASDIPTKVSELTNDSNYVTEKAVNIRIEEKLDKTTFYNSNLFKNGDVTGRITDANELPQGFTTAQNLINAPVSDLWVCYLTVFHNNDLNYATQLAFVIHSSTIYIRASTQKVWGSWKQMCPTTVDIPKTTLTPVFPNGVKVASGGATINYVVKNGWCNVNFEFNIASATALTWNDIATGLPKPANSVTIVVLNQGGKINRTIPIKINSTGSVSLRVPTEITNTDWWTGNISYPVA